MFAAQALKVFIHQIKFKPKEDNQCLILRWSKLPYISEYKINLYSSNTLFLSIEFSMFSTEKYQTNVYWISLLRN